jgi:hypothetical protein
MSVQYGVTCLDCRTGAPGVGDGGFLGAPSLGVATGSYRFEPEMITFGFLYPPLRSLGLRSYELEEFNDFLSNHDGHLLFLHSDHDDPEAYPPEVRERQDRLEEDEGWLDRFREAERRQTERIASSEFVLGFFGIRCTRCEACYAATDPGLFRAFGQMRLPAEAVDSFLQSWAPLAPDEGWNHRLMPPLDPWGPFLEQLPTFLARHRRHPLEAVLSKTPFLLATTGESLQEEKKRHDERQARRNRWLAFVWPRSGVWNWYIRRVSLAWFLLSGLPLAAWMLLSARDPSGHPAYSALVIVSSAAWAYLGARLAWTQLARTRLKTMARGVLASVRVYSPFYLLWFAQRELPPRLAPLPVGPETADAILDLHLWILPSVLLLGAGQGWLLWHYFHAVLGRGARSGSTSRSSRA